MQYAGHADVATEMEPRPRPGVPVDSSHATSLPQLVDALRRAPLDVAQRALVEGRPPPRSPASS